MTETPFARFVAPARARPQLWRLVLGAVLCFAVYAGWVLGLFGAVYLFFGPVPLHHLGVALVAPDRPWTTLALLFTFVGMAAGPVLAAALLHRRGPRTLFGPRRRVLRDFALAAGTVGLLSVVSLLAWSWLYDARPNLPLGEWLLYLPLAVPGVLLQTAAEELVFRGYLLQQLAARFRHAASGWRCPRSPSDWHITTAAPDRCCPGSWWRRPGSSGSRRRT